MLSDPMKADRRLWLYCRGWAGDGALAGVDHCSVVVDVVLTSRSPWTVLGPPRLACPGWVGCSRWVGGGRRPEPKLYRRYATLTRLLEKTRVLVAAID
jgi:hypothetical protein